MTAFSQLFAWRQPRRVECTLNMRVKLLMTDGSTDTIVVKLSDDTAVGRLIQTATKAIFASHPNSRMIARIGDITLPATAPCPMAIDLPVEAEGPVHPRGARAAKC